MKPCPDDALRFTPPRVTAHRGQTLRFIVSNSGELKHELVLGTTYLREHAQVIKKFPEIERNAPNMARDPTGNPEPDDPSRRSSTMIVLDVAGMTCGHCISAVTRAVHTIDASAEVKVDLATRRVEIDTVTAHENALRAAIEEAGYAVAPA